MTLKFPDLNGIGTVADMIGASAQVRFTECALKAADKVVGRANRNWYREVSERSGRSGDFVVILGRGSVSLGSTDTRKDGGVPVPLLVHRAGETKPLIEELLFEPFLGLVDQIAECIADKIEKDLDGAGSIPSMPTAVEPR